MLLGRPHPLPALVALPGSQYLWRQKPNLPRTSIPQEKPAVTIAAGFSLYMADDATDSITHMGTRHEKGISTHLIRYDLCSVGDIIINPFSVLDFQAHASSRRWHTHSRIHNPVAIHVIRR